MESVLETHRLQCQNTVNYQPNPQLVIRSMYYLLILCSVCCCFCFAYSTQTALRKFFTDITHELSTQLGNIRYECCSQIWRLDNVLYGKPSKTDCIHLPFTVRVGFISISRQTHGQEKLFIHKCVGILVRMSYQ